MVEIPGMVVARLAASVASVMPMLMARIPDGPAAQLGRLAAPVDPALRPPGGRSRRMAGPAQVAPGGHVTMRPGVSTESAVLAELGRLPSLLVERLHGALELTVSSLEIADVPDLSAHVGAPPEGQFAVITSDQQSEAVSASALAERLRPGAADLVASLSHRLAADSAIGQLLVVRSDAVDEPAVAAEHGRGYLALAAATASAVLTRLRLPPLVDSPAAVVGVAIGTAAALLRQAPMPAAYAAAVLAKVRAEYLLPRHSAGSVPVSGHRFALTEGEVPDAVDFSANGLVSVVDGGVVVRTGIERGTVSVMFRVLEEAPPVPETGWDEVVEVSWRAAVGRASLIGPDGDGDWQFRKVTPPWPGEYRLRVHAAGRDDAEQGSETYELMVWQAPAAAQVVYRRKDRLGHRLRGEPEPPRRERPELAYRWIRGSALEVAATVTVVTGASVAQVLEAFGADPARAEPIRDIVEGLRARRSIDPWVAVVDAGDAVIAVEDNGYQGSQQSVLCRASRWGRAASWYWSVNADTRLSFAEGGRLLESFEPWGVKEDASEPVATALAGLDFGEIGHRRGKGLVAVERFTGRGITPEDLAKIEAIGMAYRITPHLPTLYAYDPRRVDATLGLDLALIERLPEAALRDLAWWIAGEAAEIAGLTEDPDIAASIAARALTPEAHWRARRAQLERGPHWPWQALHCATNPDPRGAVTDALSAARYAVGPHAANLLDSVRARLSGYQGS